MGEKFRIENDRLTGLGLSGNESINLESLNDLVSEMDIHFLSNSLGKILTDISKIGYYIHKNDKHSADELVENINLLLPKYDEIHFLSGLVEVLNS